MNLYFHCAGQGLFFFFTCGSGILNSNQRVWQWKEVALVWEIHMHDFKSHFQQDFLAYCTWPVSVHLAMTCVIQQFFNLFAQFKTTTKSHENYVFLYPFSNMAISPQIMIFKIFIQVNCMGWQVWLINMGIWRERSKIKVISKTGLPLGYVLLFSFLKFLAENVGSLISVRLEEVQEQCYPFLPVCV